MEALAFTEIKNRFSDEWVLILNPEKDEAGEITGGRVLYHGTDKQEVYKELLKHKKEHVGLVFAGDLTVDMPTFFGGEIW